MPQFNSQAGITLVEVLIATGIVGALVGTSTVVLNKIQHGSSVNNTVLDSKAETIYLMERIRESLVNFGSKDGSTVQVSNQNISVTDLGAGGTTTHIFSNECIPFADDPRGRPFQGKSTLGLFTLNYPDCPTECPDGERPVVLQKKSLTDSGKIWPRASNQKIVGAKLCLSTTDPELYSVQIWYALNLGTVKSPKIKWETSANIIPRKPSFSGKISYAK